MHFPIWCSYANVIQKSRLNHSHYSCKIMQEILQQELSCVNISRFSLHSRLNFCFFSVLTAFDSTISDNKQNIFVSELPQLFLRKFCIAQYCHCKYCILTNQEPKYIFDTKKVMLNKRKIPKLLQEGEMENGRQLEDSLLNTGPVKLPSSRLARKGTVVT